MNNKKTAKILSLIAVLALVLTMTVVLGVTASAETTGKEIEVSNASDLTTLLSGEALADGTTLADGDTIVLTADIYMGTAGTCATAKKVTITSKIDSIYTIYRGAEGQTALTMSAGVPMFTLTGGAEVTLTNVILDGQKSVITDGKTNGSGFDVTGGAALVFGDGVVGQNFSAARGAVVYVTNGSFTLTGNAKLTANKAGTGGGAAYLKEGSMTMEGTSEISNNTSANGGAVFMLAGTFTMKDSAAIKDNTAAQHGGALQMSGTVNIHGGTISGNNVTTSKKQGGGIYMNSGTFTMTAGVITGNTTAGSGGGIYFNQGTHFISGGTIQSNTATVNGGGIGVSTATLTISGGIIGGEDAGNTATGNGGGICLLSTSGKVILNASTKIANNKAKYGGGIYSTGTLVINKAEITGNAGSGTNARGGGIAVYGGNTYMMGGSISKNTNSSQYGGGVAVSGGTFYMYGGEVANNTITAGSSGTAHGAGINVSVKGSAYLVGGTIKGNVSTGGNGRAVSIYGSVPTVNFGAPAGVELPTEAIQPTGEAFFLYENDNDQLSFGGDTNNGTASIAQVHLLGALPAGSRVCINGGAPIIDMVDANLITFADTISNADGEALLVKVTDTTREGVFSNVAVTRDGVTYFDFTEAVAVESDSALILEYLKKAVTLPAGTYTVDGAGKTFSNTVANVSMITLPNGADVTFTNITLDGTGVTSTGNGGAFSVSAGATLTLGNGVTVSNFTAKNGGAISVSGTLNVTGGEISGNAATSNGGAIYVAAGANATVSGGEIKNNNAANGAGIACDGTLNLSGGTISGNTATGYGGGVLIAGTSSNGGTNGQLNMTGGTISGNTANDKTYGGGGIYFTSRGRGAITGGTISGNTATTKGGAIYFGGTSSATYTVSNVTITGNEAATGAGIYVNSAALVTFESGEISDNHATNGGGFFVEGTLTVTGGTISANTATNNGGAISFTKALNINGGTISGNTATKHGGAISVSGTLTMTSGTISGNTAKGNGGGIYVASGKTATVSGGTISDNEAATGAGIACDGTLNLSGTALIQNNAAASFGGGLSIAGSSSAGTHGTLNMSGGTISGNTVKASSNIYGGGGIFFTSQGIGNITGGVIENNEAHHGAGIQARYLLTVTGATISGNVAKTAGAGIYVFGAAKVEIGEGTAIENNIAAALNKAMYGGGAYVAADGTLVMNGGRISGNVVTDYLAVKDSRGAGVYSLGNFWMTGGEISGNTLVGTLGCGVFCGQGNFYMLGGEIRDNVLARYANVNLPRGSALMFTSNVNSAYLIGGTIEDNVTKDSVTVEQSENATVATPIVDRDNDGNVISITIFDKKNQNQYVVTINRNLYEGTEELPSEICIFNVNAKVYIGGSIADATVPDAIVDGVNGVSVSESVVTSSNALVIPATEKGDTFGYVNGATAEQLVLNGALAEGSLVVFADNDATLDYFISLGEGYTAPNADTLAAFKFGGVTDSLYEVPEDEAALVNEAGNGLTWKYADQKYQIVVSAALDQSISFRVAFARRDPADETALDGVTVEQVTNVLNKETGLWTPKQATAEWTTGTYNGSPCIVVSLAPKMAMDQIIVKKGDVAVKNEGYSFASYLKAMKENVAYNTDAELMALVDATLNYCAAAQTYFGYNDAVLANANVTTKVDLVPEVSMTLDDPNKVFHSAQVDVASTVSVAIIVNSNGTPTVKLGKTPYTLTSESLVDVGGGYTAIVIPDLAASMLMQSITVELDGATLVYGVPAYAYNMQNKLEGSTETEHVNLSALVKALYAYAVAADAYAN